LLREKGESMLPSAGDPIRDLRRALVWRGFLLFLLLLLGGKLLRYDLAHLFGINAVTPCSLFVRQRKSANS
jgi:hypothetical protein